MAGAPSVVVSSVSVVVGLLLLLQLAQVVVESLEALLPETPVLADPVGDVAEPLRLEGARPPLRLAALFDEAGALEHLQVLRDRGQAEIERGGQLRHRRLALRKPGEHRS